MSRAAFYVPLLVFLNLLATSHVALAGQPAFSQRGYYITFMRMPLSELPDWKKAIDTLAEDDVNLLLLWMGGGFPSKKFPVTWRYNREHKNNQQNFAGELIDYAHQRKMRVILALTPFAYDGVNQFPLEHPELKARQRNGEPAQFWGIHCWGYNLCPSRAAAREFMLDYAREMYFDFYPQADGLMLESSDYAICQCPDCQTGYFDREFEFVRQLSHEVWQRKPDAQVIVYPHYFSGRKVPGFDAVGARQKFDPRWTLFFTPHSAHIDPPLIQQAKQALLWDDSPTLAGPAKIQAAIQLAAKHKLTGFAPSLEAFNFKMERVEGGESHWQGRYLKPFGFEWLEDGRLPFDHLLVRVNRIAAREFTRQPELPEAAFKETLARELFGSKSQTSCVDDLMVVHAAFFADRSWWSGSPLLAPDYLLRRIANEKWPPERIAPYRERLVKLRSIAQTYRGATNANEQELSRLADFVLRKWTPELEQKLPKP